MGQLCGLRGCDVELEQPDKGPQRKFCSPAHRAAARSARLRGEADAARREEAAAQARERLRRSVEEALDDREERPDEPDLPLMPAAVAAGRPAGALDPAVDPDVDRTLDPAGAEPPDEAVDTDDDADDDVADSGFADPGFADPDDADHGAERPVPARPDGPGRLTEAERVPALARPAPRHPIALRALRARRPRSRAVVAAGLVVALSLGGGSVVWSGVGTGDHSQVAERPDLPPAGPAWLSTARVALASVDRQLEVIDDTENRWNALPPSRRPTAAMDEVRELLDRKVVLERQRVTLLAQLATWQNLQQNTAALAAAQNQLDAVQRALNAPGTPSEQSPSVAALRNQQVALQSQVGMLRMEADRWRQDVNAVVAAPVLDTTDTTTPLAVQVTTLIDRPGSVPRGSQTGADGRDDGGYGGPPATLDRSPSSGDRPRDDVSTSAPPAPPSVLADGPAPGPREAAPGPSGAPLGRAPDVLAPVRAIPTVDAGRGGGSDAPPAPVADAPPAPVADAPPVPVADAPRGPVADAPRGPVADGVGDDGGRSGTRLVADVDSAPKGPVDVAPKSPAADRGDGTPMAGRPATDPAESEPPENGVPTSRAAGPGGGALAAGAIPPVSAAARRSPSPSTPTAPVSNLGAAPAVGPDRAPADGPASSDRRDTTGGQASTTGAGGAGGLAAERPAGGLDDGAPRPDVPAGAGTRAPGAPTAAASGARTPPAAASDVPASGAATVPDGRATAPGGPGDALTAAPRSSPGARTADGPMSPAAVRSATQGLPASSTPTPRADAGAATGHAEDATGTRAATGTTTVAATDTSRTQTSTGGDPSPGGDDAGKSGGTPAGGKASTPSTGGASASGSTKNDSKPVENGPSTSTEVSPAKPAKVDSTKPTTAEPAKPTKVDATKSTTTTTAEPTKADSTKSTTVDPAKPTKADTSKSTKGSTKSGDDAKSEKGSTKSDKSSTSKNSEDSTKGS